MAPDQPSTRMSRRSFARLATAVAGAGLTRVLRPPAARAAADPVAPATSARVLIWDERQPAQQKAYDDWLGNAIADAMTLLTLGVDGLITDSPDHAVRAVKALLVPVA